MHVVPISNKRVQIMPRISPLAFLSIFVICAVQASASAPGEVAFGGTGTSPATLNLTFSDGTQLALQAVSQGWWSGTASNNNTNQNYMIGYIGADWYADYFSFNLSSITQGAVTSATLAVQAGILSTGSPEPTFETWDVSTPLSTLENRKSGPSSTIYTDLSSGVSFGIFPLGASNPNSSVTFSLNGAAVSAINASAGSIFSIGGSYADVNPTCTGPQCSHIFHQGGSSVPLQNAIYQTYPSFNGPNQIVECIAISDAGSYVVMSPLSSVAGDCITISAAGVTLDLHGYNIAGGGTGAGIHVLSKTASGGPVYNVFVDGAVSGCAHFCQATTTMISGFSSGILDEAIGTQVENLTLANNVEGLTLNSAKDALYSDLDIYDNTGSGVHIQGGSNNTMNDLGASYNGLYGIWIDSSRSNYFGFNGVYYNSNAGIYMGCNASFGGSPTSCKPAAASDDNYLYSSSITLNGYDVVVDVGSLGNIIAANYNLTFSDFNKGCGTNVWIDNGASPACNTQIVPITSCTTIASPGVFIVQNAISSGNGDCIVVESSNVVMDLHAQNITGQGSGAGVHIMKYNASGKPIQNVLVEGAQPACGVGTSSSSDCNLYPSIISGFTAGLQDDAIGYVIGDDFETNNNQDGILLNGASNANLSNFGSLSNTGSGVHILGGSGNVIDNFGSRENSIYGVWVDGSTKNTIGNFDATSNVNAGAYLGCDPSFVGVGEACPSGQSGGYNGIFNAEVGTINTVQPIVGVAIDLKQIHNRVIQVVGTGDNWDGYDQNSLCGTNFWLDNSFTTSQPGTCTVFP
jgi:hypothetical protein